MISAEQNYETYDQKLLVIVQVVKNLTENNELKLY